MKIAIGQINSTIADFNGNCDKIIVTSKKAAALGTKLIVFPELSLCGYPPMDLLKHPAFVQDNLKALRTVQREVPRAIAVVVGYVEKNPNHNGKALQNVAAVIHNGEVIHKQAKTLLPAYDVFDETRYFEPSTNRTIFQFNGIQIGISICEDMWWERAKDTDIRYPLDPVQDLLDAGAQLLLVPSASPFYTGKLKIRRTLVSNISKSSSVPIIYANLVGANDNLIFDGRSFVTDTNGTIVYMAKGFSEDLLLGDTAVTAKAVEPSQEKYNEIEQALILGIKDYIAKTGFKRVHLGLSGGVDSALVLTLAVRALGTDQVNAFMLPSQYSSAESISDSKRLGKNLGIIPKQMAIRSIYEQIISELAPHFHGTRQDLTEENIQARIRGLLLMAYSNKYGSLLLTTGNKSELSVGYCTLYGDMAGSLAVIGDLFKTEVYGLCEYINRDKEVIPRSILTKAPSAELRPDQKDEESLPPYETLDKILELYLLKNYTHRELVAEGYEGELVKQITGLISRSEYKRRQAPPVLKISLKAFGTGRRIPIARTMYETSSNW